MSPGFHPADDKSNLTPLDNQRQLLPSKGAVSLSPAPLILGTKPPSAA
jgi:hypothetical protein